MNLKCGYFTVGGIMCGSLVGIFVGALAVNASLGYMILLLGAWGLCLYITSRSLMDDARREEAVLKLRGKGVDARCPQERRMIRRGGKWQEQLYTLFPSYIFVSTPDVYRVYYAVRHEDGVLHWLGATKGTPEALSAHEEANILWLAGDGPLPPSEAEMQADGTLDFTSGPLAHLKDMLEKVNRHDRRVTVRVPVGGEDKTITLSYRLNGRQETASNAAAGTPRSVNTADIF